MKADILVPEPPKRLIFACKSTKKHQTKSDQHYRYFVKLEFSESLQKPSDYRSIRTVKVFGVLKIRQPKT